MSDYTYADYWASVRCIVSDIMEEHAPSVGAADYDAARDAAWEAVDGCRWVFIIPQARLVPEYSANRDAWADHGTMADLAEGAVSVSDVHCRVAFYAMAADVGEALETAIQEHQEAAEEAAERAAGVDE